MSTSYLRLLIVLALLAGAIVPIAKDEALAQEKSSPNKTSSAKEQPQPKPSANRQQAQDSDAPIELGEEYVEYARPGGTKAAAKNSSATKTQRSTATKVLLYLPNRLVDLFDIFRLDLGAGPAVGVVFRATKHAQAGRREMFPKSLRLGLAGRRAPVFVESNSEAGISPDFTQSKARTVSPGEFGIGLDLGIVGAYGGLCFDEAGDFLAGIVGFDPKGDDF